VEEILTLAMFNHGTADSSDTSNNQQLETKRLNILELLLWDISRKLYMNAAKINMKTYHDVTHRSNQRK
jgi:hypothetical protein